MTTDISAPHTSSASLSSCSPSAALVEHLRAAVEALTAAELHGECTDGGWILELDDARVPFATLLATLRRRAIAADEPGPLRLEPTLLERHGRATTAADGYYISATGSYAARDQDVAADAMSLRLYSSSFWVPLDTLLRADPSRPAELLAVVDGLRRAVCSDLRREGLGPAQPWVRRLERLSHRLDGLARLDDPRLPRLLLELFVHAGFAIAASERQRPLSRNIDRPEDSPAWLYRVCELPPEQLRALRELAGDPRRSWFDPGLLGTTPAPEQREWLGPAGRPCKIELRPHFRSSAGRWLGGERQVVFPPGVRFAVLGVEEPEPGGRTSIRLAERSRLAARLAETSPNFERVDEPLYHYTVGRVLPSIVDDAEIGVAEALPGTATPAVWLSTCTDWERSAVKSVVEDGVRRELSVDELAQRCDGLFRIRVDPTIAAPSWPRFAALAGVAPGMVELLDARGRERGADPKHWYCSLTAIPRPRWRGVEMRHPELGWVALEM